MTHRWASHSLRAGWSIRLAVLISLAALPVRLPAQGAKAAPSSRPVTMQEPDHPEEREQWFQRGRTVPGQSAAALRYRAHQQKLKMRAARAAQQKASSLAALPAASSTTGWTPIGPAPLASDASGAGFQDYGWVSGRSTALAADTADNTGNTLFAGGAFGGVWKSTNAGPLATSPSQVTWTSVTDDQPSLAVGAIAIQPGNSNSANSVVLVGTGEANSSADSYYGVGLLRSSDGGTTWNLITQSADSPAKPFLGLGFTKIAFSTANPNLVVASSAASSLGVTEGAIANSTRGLYTSKDGGQTWNFELPQDSGTSITIASATSVVYNASNSTFYAIMRYHGVYSSTDGVTWTRLAGQPGSGLTTTACPAVLPTTPTCPIYRGEIAVNPAGKDMYVWYVDNNETDQGIYGSLDGGKTWTKVAETGITGCGDSGGCGTSQGTYNLELAAVPNGGATDLYAGAINIYKCTLANSSGISASCTQSGGSWLNLTHVYGCTNPGSIAHVHPDQHSVAFPYPLPGGKSLMYFANDGGVYRALDAFTGLTTGTCDNGTSNLFDDLNQTLGSMTQFVSFSIHPTDAATLLGGTQDNGSPGTASASSTTTSWGNVNAGDGGYNAIDPNAASDWFVSNPDVGGGTLAIRECSNGASCHTSDFDSKAVVTSSDLGGDDGAFYFPYILDPQSTTALLVGTCRVWRGPRLGGAATAFTALSDNFDTGSGLCTGQEVNLVRGLAAGGAKDTGGNSNVIYATTDGPGPLQGTPPVPGGRVWVTTNAAGGVSTWKDVTGSINPNGYVVSSVAIDGADTTGNSAFVTIMGFNAAGLSPTTHVWKTTNAGGSWTDFTGSGTSALPDAPANAVLVDSSTSPSTVYVGTDVGVFSTSAAAASWNEVGPASSSGSAGFLPNVAVTALRLFSVTGTKKLRASTYGRGIWEYNLLVTPDYSLSATNSPLSVLVNQTASLSVSAAALNGYTSTVNLSCTAGSTAVPPGCTPSPGSLTPASAGSTVTVSTSTLSAVADYSFNLHGVGTDANATAHDAPLTLHVVDFNLTAPSPASVSVNRPNTTPGISLQVTVSGSFAGSVTLSCSGLPAGAACQFAPSATVNPTSANSAAVTLTISTSTTTPMGTSTVTIAALSSLGATVKTQTLALTVTDFADFTLTANSPSPANAGQTTTFTGTITPVNGYASAINLACVAIGSGKVPDTCTISPASITPSGAAQNFTVTVGSSSAATFTFNVVGTGTDTQKVTHSAAVTFTSNFTFTADTSMGTQTVKAGSTATFTFKVTPNGGNFQNAVTFAVQGVPQLASATFTPSQIAAGAGTTTMTVTVKTTASVAALSTRTNVFYAIWLGLPGLGFVFGGLLLGRTAKKRGSSLALLLCALLLLALYPACGGGGNGSSGPPPQAGTPPGNYTLTVTTTTSGLSAQTTTGTLVVQ
jgi:hypothetical protein